MRSKTISSLMPFFLLAAMSGANHAQVEAIKVNEPVKGVPLRLKNIHAPIQGSKRQKRRVRGKLKEKYPNGIVF